MNTNEHYDPCLTCRDYAYCNIWDKDNCCKRCEELGLDDCENCDRRDI